MTTTSQRPQSRNGIPSAPGCSSNDAVVSIRNLRKWYNVGNNLLGIGKKNLSKGR